jgi:hypothetical protein
MPNPGGCYVLVYEQPELMGPREFLNGPSRHATLRDLPFRANWRRRIRSAHVGPAASVTLWAREGFRGPSQTLPADTRQAALIDALSGRVESLQVACTK